MVACAVRSPTRRATVRTRGLPRPMDDTTPHGWASDFGDFRGASAARIRASLAPFVRDASQEQIRAWDKSIPPLQNEFGEAIATDALAVEFGTIWEYELPLEYRRSDVILLLNDLVAVLELKSKAVVLQADADQVAAYARDLRSYHAECEQRSVEPVLVLMRARGDLGTQRGVRVLGPDAIDEFISEATSGQSPATPMAMAQFLAPDAYRPLPSLIEAARELLESGHLRRVHRANSATEPTVLALT